MTKTVTVSGYDPFDHQSPVDTTLRIVGVPPSINELDSVEQHNEWYEGQADLIADVILNSLPQGVTHRLLIKMLERYASSYRGKTGT